MKKTEELRKIKEEVLALAKSPLYKERVISKSHPVIGEGNHEAEIMFVGEAPGKNEAKSGRPFCGSAGRVLDEMLATINLKREDIYITNIIKDRPPENRDPSREEIAIYAPFLDRQINIIRPNILVALGRFSAEYLLKRFHKDDYLGPITAMNGSVIDAEAEYGIIKIMPFLHPAAVIYNQSKRDDLKKAFLALRKISEKKGG